MQTFNAFKESTKTHFDSFFMHPSGQRCSSHRSINSLLS